jgi:Bifunctional DNA primase/polymerase, N-terminal/AAA domain
MSLTDLPDRRKTERDKVNGDRVTELPDVTGMSNAEAAEEYAKAVIRIVPIRVGTKNPGSHLGSGWPARATCDLNTVRDWWGRWPDAGIAMHVGRSLLLVIDVDNPENVPAWLWKLLETAVFRPTTADPTNRRGHYFYRLRPGDRFGGGLGKLKPPKGRGWGEVRCYGGAIVLAPTMHPRAAEGGHYGTGPSEPIPFVPDEIANKLSSAPDVDEHRSLTPGELAENAKQFLRAYSDDREPGALGPILRSFDPTPGGRHGSMWDALCWALREGKAGCFPVKRAIDELRKLWTGAFGDDGRAPHNDEFERMVRDAVAVADHASVEELRTRKGGFTSVETYRIAERAMAPGGRWHSDTLKLWTAPEAAPTGLLKHDDDESSWLPVDIGRARRGDGATAPTILRRSDGASLFYRGKIHSVHGESESGKSWLTQCAAAEVLLDGEPVLYIDFEDEAAAVAERLIRLGVSVEVAENPALFVYVHPEAPPTTDHERKAFDALLSGTYSLAVVDGVTDSMGLFGLSGKDADDVAKWHQILPKALARSTGAAVVCVDHVAKDTHTRGRFALGSQHKIAGLSGAAYLVEMEQPFAVGQAGMANVRVAKDRPGRVRGLAGRWRKGDRTQHIANFRLDSTDADRTLWALDMPENAGRPTETDSAEPNSRGKVLRPMWFMEQVSRYWEETDDAADRTNNKTVKTMCDERKARDKPMHRDQWRNAIKVLADEGYAKSVKGARDSDIFTVVTPYRQHEDPLCDEYSEVAAKRVANSEANLKFAAESDDSEGES